MEEKQKQNSDIRIMERICNKIYQHKQCGYNSRNKVYNNIRYKDGNDREMD